MKHEEFEKQMFSRVNANYQMKELNRQEIERAAQEEYQLIRKCKKANAVIGIIVQIACFATTVFAVSVLNWLDEIPAVVGIAVTAVVGLFSGMTINSLANRIKN
jgi:uncharacterized ion transporter superfamily protein YfcC